MTETEKELQWTLRVRSIVTKAKREANIPGGPKWVGIRFDDLLKSLDSNIRQLRIERKTKKRGSNYFVDGCVKLFSY